MQLKLVLKYVVPVCSDFSDIKITVF